MLQHTVDDKRASRGVHTGLKMTKMLYMSIEIYALLRLMMLSDEQQVIDNKQRPLPVILVSVAVSVTTRNTTKKGIFIVVGSG